MRKGVKLAGTGFILVGTILGIIGMNGYYIYNKYEKKSSICITTLLCWFFALMFVLAGISMNMSSQDNNSNDANNSHSSTALISSAHAVSRLALSHTHTHL